MKYISLVWRLLFVSIVGVFVLLVLTPQKLFLEMWKDTIKIWKEQYK